MEKLATFANFVSHFGLKTRVSEMGGAEMPIKDLLNSTDDPFRNTGPEDLSEWKRIPGLFRRWEFAELIEDNDSISFEQHAKTQDGTELWALYRYLPRSRSQTSA